MNIWGWLYDAQSELYEAGHDDLAHMLRQLPDDIVNGRHSEVDLYIGGLIADAKTLGFSWIELYLRHWHLQSKVGHRAEPKDVIKEAVSLLEFAHSKENQDCPQSICVVQDLSYCYEKFDGPGYAEERLAVTQETLDKINPQWACYQCISIEYASALIDKECYDECLTFLDKIDKEYIENGKGIQDRLLSVRADILICQGEYAKARTLRKQLCENEDNPSYRFTDETLLTLIDALDGQYEKAFEHLPSFERIKEEHASLFNVWVEVMYLVMKNVPDKRNEDMLLQMQEVADLMLERGTYRQAVEAYGWLIELGLLFPTNLDLTALLDQMDVAIANLHRDLGASERRNDLAKRCAAV